MSVENKIIFNSIKKTLSTELSAIELLSSSITDEFINAIQYLSKLKGRIIISGVGKSAIIAQKIVATMNSTGSPAIFMHAADALHGDLGIIQKEDAVLCISKSGNTPEIKALVPLIRQKGNRLIAITNNKKSYLSEKADFSILTYVQKEACPHNLAPTSSTTAQLVLGDIIAVALLELKKFSDTDFAVNHPGGTLGKQLYTKVCDFQIEDFAPKVSSNDSILNVINAISKGRVGATAVVDNENIIGIITDGDLRRMLERNSSNITDVYAKEIMTTQPKIVEQDVLASYALEIMQKNNITQLLVTKNNLYFGIIHLHELIREGIK